MTIAEKREKVNDYCRENISCDGCNLSHRDFEHKDETHDCLYIAEATEEELDKALQLIGEQQTEPEQPLHIVQIEPADVLLHIIGREDVYMFHRYTNGNVKFTRLRDYNIDQINNFLEYKDTVFFIVK